MEPAEDLPELKRKSFIIQAICFPFPLLVGLAVYSIKHPGHYFLLSFMENIQYAYIAAAIGVVGCLIELFLLMPVFKKINALQNP